MILSFSRITTLLLLPAVLVVDAYSNGGGAAATSQSSPPRLASWRQQLLKSNPNNKNRWQPNEAALPLLEVAARPQSPCNKRAVEAEIDRLAAQAQRRPGTLLVPSVRSLSSSSLFSSPNNNDKNNNILCYRTLWSTVTAATPLGQLLGHTPSHVLGGPSWQLILGENEDNGKNNGNDNDNSKSSPTVAAENIVYWKALDLRMAGLARLTPLTTTPSVESKSGGGYNLQISGLEFRWGARGCPEAVSAATESFNNDDDNDDKSWTVFQLDETAEPLRNGVGRLEVLYHDGVVRVTRDTSAKEQNTYIHIWEPAVPHLPDTVRASLAGRPT